MDIYWIRHKEHTDRFTQGYIGVSNNPERRWSEHKAHQTNKHLSNALNKYGEDIVFEVLFSDLEEELALLAEEEYRPSENVGWNIAKGGGMPPSRKNKKHTEATKEKIGKSNSIKQRGLNNSAATPVNIYDYKTNELIAENVCMRPWCKVNGYQNTNLSKTVHADRSKPSTSSNRHQHKGLYARRVKND